MQMQRDALWMHDPEFAQMVNEAERQAQEDIFVQPVRDLYGFATSDGPGELRVQAGFFLAIDVQFTRDDAGAIRVMGGGGLGLGVATSFNAEPQLNAPSAEIGLDLSASGSLASHLSGSVMYEQRFQFEDGFFPTSSTIDASASLTPSAGGVSFGELSVQGGLRFAEDGINPHFDGGFNPKTGYTHGLGVFATARVGGNDVDLPIGGSSTNLDAGQVQDPVGEVPC